MGYVLVLNSPCSLAIGSPLENFNSSLRFLCLTLR
jgi:hypothetical protein